MKICRSLNLLLVVLVLTLSVQVAFGQSPAPPNNFVSVYEKSDIRAKAVVSSQPSAVGSESLTAIQRQDVKPPGVADTATLRQSDAAIKTITNYETTQPQPAPTPPAVPPEQAIINACAATAEDLGKTRTYASALESENKLLRERLDTEKRTVETLSELNETRRAETSALRGVVEAKNEALAARNEQIAAQEKLIAELKKKKTSIWKRIGDVALGVAIISVLR